MIKHTYKAKVCDICSKTLAVKRGLFYRPNCKYITMRADAKYSTDQVHLCDDCWLTLKVKARAALSQRKGGAE